jgi:hypothetical protein
MSAAAWRQMTPMQRKVLERDDLDYDTGERYMLLAVSGYEITFRSEMDTFGTVFTIIDTWQDGAEVAKSEPISPTSLRWERVDWIRKTRRMNLDA